MEKVIFESQIESIDQSADHLFRILLSSLAGAIAMMIVILCMANI